MVAHAEERVVEKPEWTLPVKFASRVCRNWRSTIQSLGCSLIFSLPRNASTVNVAVRPNKSLGVGRVVAEDLGLQAQQRAGRLHRVVTVGQVARVGHVQGDLARESGSRRVDRELRHPRPHFPAESDRTVNGDAAHPTVAGRLTTIPLIFLC